MVSIARSSEGGGVGEVETETEIHGGLGLGFGARLCLAFLVQCSEETNYG